PLVICIFVPYYSGSILIRRMSISSAVSTWALRLAASALFRFLRAVHVAIAIYAPSIALSLVTGLPVWQCVLLIGAVTTVYTSFGGMKAVIWTDVIQFVTICVGIGLMLWYA